jgi:hypothetical protein
MDSMAYFHNKPDHQSTEALFVKDVLKEDDAANVTKTNSLVRVLILKIGLGRERAFKMWMKLA